MNRDQILARHRVVLEQPDLITSKPNKVLTPEENEVIWAYVLEVTAGVGRFYWISDISDLERLSPTGRTQAAADVLHKLHGLACIGGSFAQRTIMTVGVRAAKLLGFNIGASHVAFFENDASARVWVNSLRDEARSQSK